MERLYLALVDKDMSIYHRPTHEFIGSCNLKEVKTVVKKLLEMDTNTFYDYIETKGVKIQLNKKVSTMDDIEMKNREDWYIKAWKCSTEKILRQNHLQMVDEDIPYDYLRDKATKKHTWEIEKKKHKKVAKKVIHEEIKETKQPKKPVRKVHSKKNSLSDILAMLG